MRIFRLFLTLINATVLLLLAGTLLNAYVSPKFFGELNLLSLGFPILMIINILICIFWVISWRKRAFVFVLISILFLTPIRRWINFNETQKTAPDLKVMTYNMRAGNTMMDKKNLIKFVINSNCDVVLIQEVGQPFYWNMKLPENYYKTNYTLIGLITKHKVIKIEPIILNDVESQDVSSFYADIEIKGKIIRFINIYLAPFFLEKSKINEATIDVSQNKLKAKYLLRKLIPTFKIHQEQIEKIQNFAKNSPYPVILGGDFNSMPNSYEYYHLGDGLQDAFLEAGNGSATSFHDYKFPIRIDYLFSSKSLKPDSYKVDRSVHLSDHFPVIATFSFK